MTFELHKRLNKEKKYIKIYQYLKQRYEGVTVVPDLTYRWQLFEKKNTMVKRLPRQTLQWLTKSDDHPQNDIGYPPNESVRTRRHHRHFKKC